MNHETFEKLLEAIEQNGEIRSDLGTLSEARSLRNAFYTWRRGLGEETELKTRSERVMVNVQGGRIRFYLRGKRMEQLVEGLLQRTA